MQLYEKIPNNVNLSENRRLQRALEKWQPNYMKWWKEAGPDDFQEDQIYLRTAISVDASGWANFDYVKMPDYKWGIFLADQVQDRTIPSHRKLRRRSACLSILMTRSRGCAHS